ncbi:flagella synthesis protein FlgN [Thiomicrorhabdus sp.]|uniref:flagella synthesis protein FlgN n=1 Tax=Thiomicrorhabdus sp. TaxID=2039724 RepID=UPI002AA8C107|nr:flagellar export chaperone FlgN [Thiomicrorhabdus sp.]
MTDQLNELNSNQFPSQIEELVRLLNQFSDVLDTESNCIKKNLPEKLIENAQNKNALADQLSNATNRIEKQLEPLNLTLTTLIDHNSFQMLSANTQANIRDLMVKIKDCHDKNLANGMSIQMLSNINKHALDLISGKPQDLKLYGSSGEKTNSSSSQGSLGKA